MYYENLSFFLLLKRNDHTEVRKSLGRKENLTQNNILTKMSHQIFFISDVPFRHILLNHLLRAKKIQKKRLSALELPVKEWNLGVISVTHPSTPLTPAIERLRKRTDAADASTSTSNVPTINHKKYHENEASSCMFGNPFRILSVRFLSVICIYIRI